MYYLATLIEFYERYIVLNAEEMNMSTNFLFYANYELLAGWFYSTIYSYIDYINSKYKRELIFYNMSSEHPPVHSFNVYSTNLEPNSDNFLCALAYDSKKASCESRNLVAYGAKASSSNKVQSVDNFNNSGSASGSGIVW